MSSLAPRLLPRSAAPIRRPRPLSTLTAPSLTQRLYRPARRQIRTLITTKPAPRPATTASPSPTPRPTTTTPSSAIAKAAAAASRPRPNPIRTPLAPRTADPAAAVDWATSYHGVASAPFAPEAVAVLRRPLDPADVEIKPDGIVFLPEIKYRNILFEAFGPGGWGMVPRGEPEVGARLVTREWALMVHGR